MFCKSSRLIFSRRNWRNSPIDQDENMPDRKDSAQEVCQENDKAWLVKRGSSIYGIEKLIYFDCYVG